MVHSSFCFLVLCNHFFSSFFSPFFQAIFPPFFTFCVSTYFFTVFCGGFLFLLRGWRWQGEIGGVGQFILLLLNIFWILILIGFCFVFLIIQFLFFILFYLFYFFIYSFIYCGEGEGGFFQMNYTFVLQPTAFIEEHNHY